MNNFIFYICIVVMVAGYLQFGVTMILFLKQECMNQEIRRLRDHFRGHTIEYRPWSPLFFAAVVATCWVLSGAQI